MRAEIELEKKSMNEAQQATERLKRFMAATKEAKEEADMAVRVRLRAKQEQEEKCACTRLYMLLCLFVFCLLVCLMAIVVQMS